MKKGTDPFPSLHSLTDANVMEIPFILQIIDLPEITNRAKKKKITLPDVFPVFTLCPAYILALQAAIFLHYTHLQNYKTG